jgi:hypothetical protein
MCAFCSTTSAARSSRTKRGMLSWEKQSESDPQGQPFNWRRVHCSLGEFLAAGSPASMGERSRDAHKMPRIPIASLRATKCRGEMSVQVTQSALRHISSRADVGMESLWISGAPEPAFSVAIRRISARRLSPFGGRPRRPRRDSQVQYRRSGTVPAYDRRRLHEHEHLGPARPPAT